VWRTVVLQEKSCSVTGEEAEGYIPETCELRHVNYLNNLIEQDHRCLKRLTKPGMGFFSFETAWRTLRGYAIMNMIRKGQVYGVDKGDVRR
jgi:transposase-like protein